jgi:hypothetical protein
MNGHEVERRLRSMRRRGSAEAMGWERVVRSV